MNTTYHLLERPAVTAQPRTAPMFARQLRCPSEVFTLAGFNHLVNRLLTTVQCLLLCLLAGFSFVLHSQAAECGDGHSGIWLNGVELPGGTTIQLPAGSYHNLTVQFDAVSDLRPPGDRVLPLRGEGKSCSRFVSLSTGGNIAIQTWYVSSSAHGAPYTPGGEQWDSQDGSGDIDTRVSASISQSVNPCENSFTLTYGANSSAHLRASPSAIVMGGSAAAEVGLSGTICSIFSYRAVGGVQVSCNFTVLSDTTITLLISPTDPSTSTPPEEDPARPPLLGGLKAEYYTDLLGSTLAHLTSSVFFPDSPNLVEVTTEFESRKDWRDNYGARLSGWLIPPTTGDYRFFLASDDQGALFLSTDEAPANKVQIASEPAWNGYREYTSGANQASRGDPPVNISTSIPLVAGRAYYVEALLKEGTFGDHLSVAWQMPDEPEPANGAAPIPGIYLASSLHGGELPPNAGPVAVDDAYSLGEDMIVSLGDPASGVLKNDTDADGDTLTAILVNGPAHGTLTLQTDGRFTYTPVANYNGLDAFTYKVNDGTADSGIATVTITVNPVNDAPVANSQSVTTAEDTAITITLIGSDVDGDALSLGVVNGPAHGTLSINSPTVIYTPAANYHGADTITFAAHDGKAFSAPATITITVTPVNDAPVDRNRSVGVLEDNGGGQVQPQVDVDGDAVTYFVVTPPQHGRVELQGGNLIYLPELNYTGPDSYTFKATDGTLESPDYTYTINVLPVNDAPVAVAQTATTDEDTAAAITLRGSDFDGDALSFEVINVPSHGTLNGTAPNLTYMPAANYHGPDSFTFTVSDGTATPSAATVLIMVIPVNDAPVAADDDYTATEDGLLVASGGIGSLSHGGPGAVVGSVDRTATFDAVISGTDLSNYMEDGLRVSVPKVGFISGALYGGYFYPNGGANATTSIRTTDGAKMYALEFATSDGWGDPHPISYLHWWMVDNNEIVASGVFETGHRTVSGFSRGAGFDELLVGAYYTAAGAEAATPTSYQALALDNLKVQVKPPGLLANDTDAEGHSLSAELLTGPQHGTVILQADGSFSYSPDVNFAGADAFTYWVNDGTTYSAAATVSIAVTAVNDLPTAAGQALTTYDNAPLAITLAGGDVETNPLTYRIVSAPAQGLLGGAPPNVVYTPPFPFAGNDSFTFEVEDAEGATASATVAITILASDRPPMAVAGPDQSVVAGANCEATVIVDGNGSSDEDGDALGFTWQLLVEGEVVDTVTGQSAVSWSLTQGSYEAVLTVSTDKNGTLASRSDRLVITVVPSAPDLAALSPAAGYAGGPDFNLTVTGGCFLPGTVVHWNGSPRTTTVVGSGELVASIPASDLLTGVDIAVAAVTVVNGDGQASNPLGFSIVAQTVGIADAAVTAPGETSTVSTAPTTDGEPGVTVVVQNGGDQPVTVLAATYDEMPVGETAFRVDNGSFVDVQVTGAREGVSATVFFYYPSDVTGGMENRVKLRYFNGVDWIPVLSSGGLPPAKDTTDHLDGTVSGGRFAVLFDSTSTPPITELTGTVFGMFESEPQLGAITGPSGPVALGNAVSVMASFAVVGDPSDAVVRFLWDDGTETIVAPETATSATAMHLYNAPGVYVVTVQVTDVTGEMRERRFEYVVIYDPYGGFVTGGGWIESASGAYLYDLTLTGKATFGFNSKYRKGQTVPSGETQFQFQAGDFKFQSAIYDWLVVSGAKAQYKGVGQVNGTGDYGFLLTAMDGQLNGGADKFRIKIWDRASGVIVYDSRRGASDDLDAADPQAINGGSIVIHKAK